MYTKGVTQVRIPRLATIPHNAYIQTELSSTLPVRRGNKVVGVLVHCVAFQIYLFIPIPPTYSGVQEEGYGLWTCLKRLVKDDIVAQQRFLLLLKRRRQKL